MTATIEVTMHEKKEDAMGGKFERTFVVAVPVAKAWSALTDPEELNKWYFPFRVNEDGSTETEILGQERTSEVVEFVPGQMFRTQTVLTGREGPGIMPGTREMTVVLEATDSGTKITITHSGFGEGPDWERAMENTRRGSNETIADLVLYLETGVAFPRHLRGMRSEHGILATEGPAGLEVVAVVPDAFGQRLGLQAGDILVELGGATLFGLAELQFFCKEHSPGEQVAAAWVRGGQLMRGSADLGERMPVP